MLGRYGEVLRGLIYHGQIQKIAGFVYSCYMKTAVDVMLPKTQRLYRVPWKEIRS